MSWCGQRRARRAAIDASEAAKYGKKTAPVVSGNLAARRGESPVLCPHELGTAEHNWWMMGWRTGLERRMENA